MTRAHQTNANPYTYRDEQITNDNSGISYRKKGRSAFKSDTTFSKRKALEWIARGYRVYKVMECSGRILEMYN